MNYMGAYSEDTIYPVGAVVVFSDDNTAYIKTKTSDAGVYPHDVYYWNRLDQPYQEIVVMFNQMFGSLAANTAEVASLVESVIFDEKTIILESSSEDSDKVYALTVEDGDSGGELVISEVEEEESAEDGET